jgi:hypothetical protein
MNSSLYALIGNLTSPGTMIDAEQQLLAAGADAVPVLEAIFNGEAKNEFGVPYRLLGLPLERALEVAARLGPLAKPLEPWIREEVVRDVYRIAPVALRRMPPLEDGSIVALAGALSGVSDTAFEATVTLIELGHAEHPAVQDCIATSPAAAKMWQTVVDWKSRSRRRSSESREARNG